MDNQIEHELRRGLGRVLLRPFVRAPRALRVIRNKIRACFTSPAARK